MAISFSTASGLEGRRRMHPVFRGVTAHHSTAPGRNSDIIGVYDTRPAMLKTLLQAKLHRVRLTEAILHYEGSCGIDEALLEISGIREFQYIEVYNINNAERFATYVIRAPRGSGTISLNGAAARKAMVGDLLIICAYSQYSEVELASYRPAVVMVDERNRPRSVAVTG